MMMVMVELWFKLARDFLTVGSKPTQLLILEVDIGSNSYQYIYQVKY